MPATATKVSPFMDNLRHMYEAGRSAAALAYWYNMSRPKMERILRKSGAVLRGRGTWRTIEKQERLK